MDSTILRRLRGEPKTRRFATIDIETRKWVEPYAVGFYDGSRYVDFIDYTFQWKAIDDALRFVLRPEYAGYWIYAHNGGNFDFTFFLNRLITTREFKTRYSVDIIPIGSTVVTYTVVETDPGVHYKDCPQGKCRGCKPKRVDNRDQKWTFVDSARTLPMTLEEVGETFNVTRKVTLEMSYDELARPANRQTMQHYLKVDCVSLYEGLDEVQKTVNSLGGQMGITLPSTSMDLFRRAFQKDDIHTNRHWLSCPLHGEPLKKGDKRRCADGKSYACLHDFIRDAYFGGRTEIFRMAFNPYFEVKRLPADINRLRWNVSERGYDYSGVIRYRDDPWGQWVRHANLYDVNSHYPNCMLEPMPVGPAVEMHGLTESQVYNNARRLVGIVECEVEIPDDCYLPPLPVKQNGKLKFPTGRLRGTWDTAELALLPRVGGRIVRTFRSVWFETSPVFARFIRTLYKYRQKKLPDGSPNPKWRKALDRLAKLLMNSLYGKWAMKVNRQKIVIHPSSPEGKVPINFEADIWAEETVVNPIYVLPQMSVHVCAVARARLWEINWDVIQKGGRIYYSDTDSLICAGATLETGSDLGALKHEATIKRGVFTLPKLYLVETTEANEDKQLEKHLKIKSKGMGPGIRIDEEGDDPYDGQLSEKDFFELVRKGVPIQRHRITKLKEALNEFAKNATQFPRVIPSTKAMKSSYDKRTVLDDYNTAPISVAMF